MAGLELLIDLGIIAIFATVFAYLSRLIRQPMLLAYIVAGLIIGPIGLGLITARADIAILSELGIAFLLFTVGIETDFRKLMRTGKIIVIGGILQVLITALIVFAAMVFLGLGFIESVYLGLILAFSSTMLVVKILSDDYQINTLHGRLLIGFLLVQDILVILALPLLMNIEAALSAPFLFTLAFDGLLILAFGAAANKLILPRLMKYSSRNPELLFLTALSTCFVFIVIAYYMQFSIAIGAFVAGIAMGTLPYNLEVIASMRGIRDFFVTIFFVSLGMQLTGSFAAFPLTLIVLIFAAIYIIKPLVFFLITLIAGYGGRTSSLVALSMANVSEFSFILAGAGAAAGHISSSIYSLVILSIAVSMATTPYMMKYASHTHRILGAVVHGISPVAHKILPAHRLEKLERLPDEKKLKDHIIIVGGGALGSGLAHALYKEHEVVVVDNDPEIVASYIKRRVDSAYGNVENEDLWRKLNLKDAKLLVITIPDESRVLYLVNYAKHMNKELVIFARAHHYEEALELYEKGADFVVLPEVVGSNVMLKNIATFLDTGKVYIISNLKDEYLEYLKEQIKQKKKMES